MESIVDKLTQKNIKPSYQRLLIYRYLYEHRTHPTVNEVYVDLKEQVPTLSKTTVYNTIKLFIDSDLIQEVLIDGSEVRLDAEISTHGHFKCTQCGKIYDVAINKIEMENENRNFIVKKTHIYFTGICSDCFKKKL